MTDKYDEFKEWFTTKKFKAKKDYTWYDASLLFREFEEDYKEKHQKEEIINIIWQTLKENSVELYYQIDGIHCKEHPAEAIYNKLKEKDMIK